MKYYEVTLYEIQNNGTIEFAGGMDTVSEDNLDQEIKKCFNFDSDVVGVAECNQESTCYIPHRGHRKYYKMKDGTETREYEEYKPIHPSLSKV